MPKKTIALGAIILALSTFMSCQIPDYQLGFEITGAVTSGNYVNVDYELTNIGFKNLENASIRIEADTNIGYDSDWTTQTNLEVGETKTGTLSIYFGVPVSSINATYVTGTAWDSEDDSGWF